MWERLWERNGGDMPKKAKELGALDVKRLTTPGRWPVGGVDGLALLVKPSGARAWVLRAMVAGKRRDMGMGSYPTVSLAQARAAARTAHATIRDGTDPVEQAQAKRSAAKAAQAAALTFSECARRCIADKAAGWKNAKHGQQWVNTIEQWAGPHIGKLRVRDVGLPQVLAVLQQPADPDKPTGPTLWQAKTETASRLRGRIETVLAWATVRGLRSGDNPARWRGHLDALLPAPAKVAAIEHHPALAIGEVGRFMVALRQREGLAARALELAALTATRSGEVRGAKWVEFDLATRVWTIPATRMKAGKEHRVPLSDAAVALLQTLPKIDASALVFPGATHDRAGNPRPLSDMALSEVMRRMEVAAVPHGLRSTFRDWAGERTAYAREVIEHALAHQLKNKAEAAYARGDLFDKRRRLMADWCAFLARVETPASEQGANVLPLAGRGT